MVISRNCTCGKCSAIAETQASVENPLWVIFDDFQRLLETPDLRVEHDHGAIGNRALEEKHGSSSVFTFLPRAQQKEVL